MLVFKQCTTGLWSMVFDFFFVHYRQVALESVKIYNAISDGTINLVDKVYFLKLTTLDKFVKFAYNCYVI